MSNIEVSSLTVYPIKSCGGVDVNEARVTPTGFEFDREFMLVDTDGTFITQRTDGAEKLARVAIQIEDEQLVVSADDNETVIPLHYDPHLPAVETVVHRQPTVGRDQGDEISQFFSDFLESETIGEVRLLRASREHPRKVTERYDTGYEDTRVALSDSFPFLLTSEKSLLEQHWVDGLQVGEVPMNRFRPNIVVASVDIDGGGLEAYEEDRWKEVLIGDLRAFVVRACARCKIPSIIQSGPNAGQIGDVAVLSRFLESRVGIDLTDPDRPKGRFFGQNLMAMKSDHLVTVRLGDQVQVLEQGDSNIHLRRPA